MLPGVLSIRGAATLPDLEDSVKTPVAFGGAARAKQGGSAKNQDKQTVWNTRFHFVTTREKVRGCHCICVALACMDWSCFCGMFVEDADSLLTACVYMINSPALFRYRLRLTSGYGP